MDTITATSNTFPEPPFDSANSVEVDDTSKSYESIDQSSSVLMMKGNTLPITTKEKKKPKFEQPRTDSAWLRAYNPSHHQQQNHNHHQATKLMELVVPYWLKKHHPHNCFQYNYGHHNQQRFCINNYQPSPSTLLRQPSTNFSIDSILNGSSKSGGTPNNGDNNDDINGGGDLHQSNQRSQPTQLSLLNDREQFFKFFQHYTETGGLILPATTTTTPPSSTLLPSPILPPPQSFSTLGKMLESPPESTATNPERPAAKRRPLNRGPRIPFTPNQVLELESKFNQTQYLSSMEVSLLAKRLNLSDSRVRIWFQNRRAREKREHHHNNHHHHHQTQHLQNYHQNPRATEHVPDDEGDEDQNSSRNKSIFDHDLVDNNNGDYNVRVTENPDEDEDQNDASSMLTVIMEERRRQQDDRQEGEDDSRSNTC